MTIVLLLDLFSEYPPTDAIVQKADKILFVKLEEFLPFIMSKEVN
jgi:hypothetical protein